MNPNAPAGAGFLQTVHLAKRFDGITAVDDVSLSIGKGEIFALLGSSGCGKSTLLRMLAGFEKPSAGAVLLGGADMANLPPYQRPVNMMFQSYALFPHLNVWENIAFGLKREGMPRAQISARVSDMLDLVELAPYASRKPEQLSGGQQQRVALARSLAKNPQLLLLDEPLGALDKKLRERTQFELVHILKSVGVTCVMVTHDQEEAMSMASRVAVMSHGRVMQVGTPREVYDQPSSRFVAEFIGNLNLFEGRVIFQGTDHCEIETAWGTLVAEHRGSTTGAALAVAVRPEKINIAKQRPSASQNLFMGKVAETAYRGGYSMVVVDLQSADGTVRPVKVTRLNATNADSSTLASGDNVFLWWDATAAVVLTH